MYQNFKKGDKWYYMDPKFHAYPINQRTSNTKNNSTLKLNLEFKQDALKQLNDSYYNIHGLPKFINRILELRKDEIHIKNIAFYSEFYRFIPELNLLIMPNSIYFDDLNNNFQFPKQQKLKNDGITLCAWFIHPELQNLFSYTKQLLQELSLDYTGEKSLIQSLRKYYCDNKNQVFCDNQSGNRNEKTIKEIEKLSKLKYYKSILDIDKSDVNFLERIYEEFNSYLKDIYMVDQDDFVNQFIHFPYGESTTTLHIHCRVNHGSHPFYQVNNFELTELIKLLKDDITIENIINQRLEKLGYNVPTDAINEKAFFQNISALNVTEEPKNIFQAKHDQSILDSYRSKSTLDIDKSSSLNYL